MLLAPDQLDARPGLGDGSARLAACGAGFAPIGFGNFILCQCARKSGIGNHPFGLDNAAFRFDARQLLGGQPQGRFTAPVRTILAPVFAYLQLQATRLPTVGVDSAPILESDLRADGMIV